MKPDPHTRESLGVPDWFFCDGCSHAPDLPWLSPTCDAHDWDYWRGMAGGKTQADADRDFRARIKHNAKYYPGSWWDRRWRPLLGDVYYFAVTRFGGSSFRSRDTLSAATWEELAIVENKHARHQGGRV